jgi:hypothetical protein
MQLREIGSVLSTASQITIPNLKLLEDRMDQEL